MEGTTHFISNTISSFIGWMRKPQVQPDDIEQNTQGIFVLPIDDDWEEIIDLRDVKKNLHHVALRKVVVQQ